MSILPLFSCSNFTFRDGINHGVIEYTISYPDIPTDSYILDLMPKTMEITFKDDNYRSDIIAGMGLFQTSIIHEAGKEKLLHSVKMLNKKYASELNNEQIADFNPDFQQLEITRLDEKKEIAGYECNAATAKVLGDSSWTFKLYYTDHIRIKDANIHTPFREIEGVLMMYEIYSYKTRMIFTASSVLETEIEDSELELGSGYEMVEPEDLKKEIEAIFDRVR